MDFLDKIVYNYVFDTTWFWGPNPSSNQEWIAHCAGLFVVAIPWFLFFTITYGIADRLSYKFLPKYPKMNKMEKTDWTSRIVASISISIGIYFCVLFKIEGDEHRLEPDGDVVTFQETTWFYHKELSTRSMYLIYHNFAALLGYELYDLKNCIDIKMTSGIIHHIVLIVLFPIAWHASILAIPGVMLVQCTYISNIPAHVRCFLANLGYRDTAFYRWNRWAWWVSYIIFRLMGIPWSGAQVMWQLPALKVQTNAFVIVWYFSSIFAMYGLSVYWFVNMSKTLFPPKDYDIRKIESFGALPQPKNEKQRD